MRIISYLLSISTLLVILTIISCKEDTPKPIVTVEFKPGVEGMDAYISSYPNNNYTNRNFGDHPEFQASAWTAGESFVVRSLIKFNLESIPPSSSVKNAVLNLYSVDNTVNGPGHSTLSGSNAWKLQQVAAGWSESTVTWNTQPVITVTNSIDLPASMATIQDYQIDVTAFVANMVKNPSTNHGLLLRLADETIYRRILFASSDHPDSSKHPKLVVTYQ